jgi:hypothetical protein
MRMIIHHRTCFTGRAAHKFILLLLASAFSLACVSPAAAQKKKKPEQPPPADSSKMLVSMSDEQQIDYMLSEMLGAWQLGDVEKLRQDYAEDVAVVNGSLQYLYKSERHGGLGVLPVGVRRSCGRPAEGIPGPDHGSVREAQQPLGYRA